MGIQINGNNDIISALDGSWTAEGASINTSGILTATTFKGNIVGTAATFTGPITGSTATFSGTVSIGGTLTYEDVTNIDSVGLVTARTGLISPYADIDDWIDVGSNIKLGNAGVVTATSFVGGLPISNEGNDRIITSSGSGAVNAEANLQFDGTNLFMPNELRHLGDPDTKIGFPAADQIQLDTAGTNYLKLHRYSSVNFTEVGANAQLSLADNGSNSRNVMIGDGDHTSTGQLFLQAGGRSTGYGGAITMYSHSNSTNAGGVYIGKSLNSSGSIIFGNGGTSPSNEYARITSNGYFGVGETPTTKVGVALAAQQADGTDDASDWGAGGIFQLDATGSAANGNEILLLGAHSGGVGQIASGLGFGRENTGNWGTYLSFKTHSTSTSNIDELNERIRIDANGKIGVGLVPNAWQASTVSKVIQIGNSSVWDYNLQQFDLGQNFYYDGTNYKYIANGYATKLSQLKSDGSFIFYNAASGTGGNNLTWLQKIKVNNGYAGTVDVKGIPAHLRLYSQRDTSDWDSTDPIGKLDFYVGDDTTNNLPYNAGFIHCLNETDNTGEPSGALVFGVTASNASGGASERLRIMSNGKIKFYQDPNVRASATGGGVDTYGGSGLGEGGYIQHYTARDGGHYRRVMDIASVGDASWGSQIRFVTHDDGGASTTTERARITHDGTWLHNSKHQTLPLTTRTKLIPYYWDRYHGTTKFIFAFSVSVTSPKLWILTARTQDLAGTIKFGFSRRTNWPTNGVGRMHNSMWRISNYGDGGDNEYSQLRENENVYQNAAGTYKVTVGSKGVDYIYQNHGGSAHSEFGDNSGKAQDYHSRWWWHFDTCPQSPAMQYHTMVCEMELVGGWNYDGTDDSATNFYAYVED